MTLYLKKTYNYVNPYYSNWHYLDNMTFPQVELLQEMRWNKGYKYIRTASLRDFPWTFNNEIYAKNSVKRFIDDLNYTIKVL